MDANECEWHRESPLEKLGGLKEIPLRKGGEGVVNLSS